MLIHAVDGQLVDRMRAFTDNPKDLSRRVTKRPDFTYPSDKVLLSSRQWLAQPMTIFGQIEFASAARNAASMLDRIEEYAVLQRLQKLGADCRDSIAAFDKLAQHGFEAS